MASLHPVKRHLLIAPNSKGECGIFDLRSKTKKLTPVISLLGHTKSLSSATFSSVVGDDVVTVCWDNKVRIYDIRKGDKITPKKQIVHNNNTGQWLTTFKVPL
jgi:WD repeat-containing protein 76